MIQRKTMDQVHQEQETRRKGTGDGTYTTVGFEWDIAKTTDNAKETNILQGLSHAELAKSAPMYDENGLPYMLETDAGNVLEFVTPPMYIKTHPGQPLPLLDDLTEIKDAMQQGLAPLVKPKDSIQDLMDKEAWGQFGIKEWNNILQDTLPLDSKIAPAAKPGTSNALAEQDDQKWPINSRNWSWNVPHSRTQILQSLQGGTTLSDVKISESTVPNPPQINIATDATNFQKLQKLPSRLGSKDEHVKDFNKLKGQVQGMMETWLATDLPKANKKSEDRIQTFINYMYHVLAQQVTVPSIKQTATLQQQGWHQGNVTKKDMEDPSGKASFIKDTDGIWLKTDLLTFGTSVLKQQDWTTLIPLLEIINDKLQANGITFGLPDSYKCDKEEFKVLIQGVIIRLLKHAESLSKSSDGNYGAQVVKLLKEIDDNRPRFNEHSEEILGVRQDTFISPLTMLKLRNKLGFKQLLHVMEIRNTEDFIEWLRDNEKQLKKKLPAQTDSIQTESVSSKKEKEEVLE